MLILVSINILAIVLDLMWIELFSLYVDKGFDTNVTIFDADISLSVHLNHNKEGIFILCKGLTQTLDGTMLTTSKEYAISFSKKRKVTAL